MVFIYILQLENNKYYIGKTTNPNFRLDQHFNSHGSQWTKKYKPLKVLDIIPNCDNFDEDKYTIKYMTEHGINNVRGGTFCELKLNENNMETIKKMINGSTDKCYICGNSGHFAKNCEHDDDNILEKVHYNKKNEELKSVKIKKNKKNVCNKCGRKSHSTKECYATTTVDGDDIEDEDDEEEDDEEDDDIEDDDEYDDNEEESGDTIYQCSYCNKEFNTLKGLSYHEKMYCKNKKNRQTNTCNKCGRKSHSSKDCYATTTVDGDDVDEELCDTIYQCSYCNKEFNTLKGLSYHEKMYCKNKKKLNSKYYYTKKANE